MFECCYYCFPCPKLLDYAEQCVQLSSVCRAEFEISHNQLNLLSACPAASAIPKQIKRVN